jgi:hypothetical protein
MSNRIHVPGVGSYYRRGRHWTIEYWIDGQPVWESVTRLLQRRPETITAKDAERCLRTRKGQGPRSWPTRSGPRCRPCSMPTWSP